jgi:hypothetical protein
VSREFPRRARHGDIEASLSRSCRKGRYAPPVHMIKMTETQLRLPASSLRSRCSTAPAGKPQTSSAWRSTRPSRRYQLQSKDLGLNANVVNVEGGAIAHGHPIGASGAVLTTRLLHSMKRDGLKRGIVTLCIGGDQGIALALETVN